MTSMIGVREVWVNGQRYYTTPYGHLPSVTTIIKETRSAEDNAKLEKWRAEEPDAEEIMKAASARGKELHAQVEAYLRTGVVGSGRWWTSVWPFLQNVERDADLLIETPVASPEGYAGCLDLLARVDGELVLIDWKTSTKRKRREWVGDYMLQAAAYTAAVNFDRFKRGLAPVGRATIVVAYETRICDTFELTRTELIATYRVFLERLAAFKRARGGS